MTEADLARHVVAWLRGRGWTVYEEVVGPTGCRADIVATRGDPVRVLVAEVKNALTFDVIAQALGWLPYAHQVYAAVPARERGGAGAGRLLARSVMHERGVGLIERRHPRWSTSSEMGSNVRVALESRDHAGACADQMLADLHPEQQTMARAGTNGGYFTDFRATVGHLRDLVLAEPGIPLKTALERLHAEGKSHYKTVRGGASSLERLIRTRVVDEVEARVDGEPPVLRLYPATT